MDDEIRRAEEAKRGSPYLNTAQAAFYLGVSQSHLEKLRSRGGGPVFRRHLPMVQYHVDDLIAWSKSRSSEPNA